MTDRPTRADLIRRVLSVAICYVVALQAFLAAFGTAFAVAQGQSGSFVICHGGESTTTDGGDSGTPASPPCVLCAVATAGGGLLPDPVVIVLPAPVLVSIVEPAAAIVLFASPPARAGLARAPPSYA